MSHSPYYDRVPKTLDANLRFRREVIELGTKSRSAARELWVASSRDLLFYLNTFGWTYDPRKTQPAIPFITYPFQDEALLAMDAAIGVEDLLLTKSRDMGCSWLSLMVCEWRWHFRDLQSFLLVSRKEDLVDKSGDPKSLFWKIDFALGHHPKWLLPNFTRNKLALHNDDNGSTIDGESTTGDVARGDRRTGIFLDEFAFVENQAQVLAATADATNTRIFNSTYQSDCDRFYQLSKTNIRKLRLHWSQHPEKAVGLYTTEGGKLKRLDQHAFPVDYPFILDGKLRSVFYDIEWNRRANAVEICRELDIDPQGAQYQFYESAILDRIQREYVRPAFKTGDIDFVRDTHAGSFLERDRGPFRLWCNLDLQGKPQLDRRYVVGCDVSAGSGASNTCAAICDLKTGEKVGEYTTPRIDPHDFADTAIAIAKLFGNAKLIWERNGPGSQFGKRVISLGYRNVYYRRDEMSLSMKEKDTPGWSPTKDYKRVLLGEHRRAIASGEFVERSYEAVEECRHYIHMPSGSIEHAGASASEDPTGAKDNHGDRVIASALCVLVLTGTSQAKNAEVPAVPPYSFAWRREQRERDRKELAGQWLQSAF